MAIDNLPPLREVIAAHGLAAKKQLGQNFLLDLNLTSRIARTSGPLEEVTVIEVGPGPGGLTRALLAEGARRVIAIERDERALPALAEIAAAYPGRLEVIARGDEATRHVFLVNRTDEEVVVDAGDGLRVAPRGVEVLTLHAGPADAAAVGAGRDRMDA